jgi:streptogramin lyase
LEPERPPNAANQPLPRPRSRRTRGWQPGRLEAEIEASRPTRFLATADSLWLTSYPEGVVERIDPGTNEVVFHARLGGNLNGITEGDGAIWVGDTALGKLFRVDPAATGTFD